MKTPVDFLKTLAQYTFPLFHFVIQLGKVLWDLIEIAWLLTKRCLRRLRSLVKRSALLLNAKRKPPAKPKKA